MNRHTFALAATVLLVAPSGVFAQGSSRPYQGLFGGDNDPAVHHRLDASLALVAAYDDDVLPSVTGGFDPTTRPFNGYNTTFTGIAQYAYQRKSVQAGLSISSSVRQYPEFHNYNMTHSAAAGFSAQFARRTSVFVNQTVDYSPPYLFGLFPSVDTPSPGAIVSGGPNYLLDNTRSLTYGTIATVGHGLTRRGTVSASADYHFTDFSNNDTGRSDVRSHGFRTQYVYALGRSAAFTAGYHYRSGQLGFGTIAVTVEQGAEVGISYTRKLSPTRRAVFSFNVGSTTMDLPNAPDAGLAGGKETGVSADAALSYAFGRSWLVRGAYRRGAEFVAEFTDPIFADGVTLSLGGSLSRRLYVRSSAAYSSGESLQLTNSRNLKTYTGSVQLGYEMTRAIGSYVEYLYYSYDLAGNQAIAPLLLTSVQRNGVRAGLTFSFSMRRR